MYLVCNRITKNFSVQSLLSISREVDHEFRLLGRLERRTSDLLNVDQATAARVVGIVASARCR